MFFKTREALLTLIGVGIVKFGTGGMSSWGNMSIYFFSYYKQTEPELEYEDMQIMISYMAILTAIFSLLSIKIGEKFGYPLVVKITCILYPISIYISSYCDTSTCFNVYSILIPGSFMGTGLMPLLYCLWSHFQENRGYATGVTMFMYGVSNVFFNLLSTLVVNPNNIEAECYIEQHNQKSCYFGGELCKNVPTMVRTLAILYFIFCFVGSLFITQNQNMQLKLGKFAKSDDEDNCIVQSERQSIGVKFLKQLSQSQLLYNYTGVPITKKMQQQINEEYLEKKQKNQEMKEIQNEMHQSEMQQEQKEQFEQQDLEFSQDLQQQFVRQRTFENLPKRLSMFSSFYIQDIGDEKDDLLINGIQPGECPDLKTALTSAPFIIIWVSTFFISLYSMFFWINFKVYCLTKINDDHFLTYVGIAGLIFASCTNIIWGIFLDRINFKIIYMAMFFLQATFAFSFPFIADKKIPFIIWYLMLSSFERGLYTIIGPVLIKIFGLRIGGRAFPFKITSFIAALALAPILQQILNNFLSYDSIFIILGLFDYYAASLTTKFKISYTW